MSKKRDKLRGNKRQSKRKFIRFLIRLHRKGRLLYLPLDFDGDNLQHK